MLDLQCISAFVHQTNFANVVKLWVLYGPDGTNGSLIFNLH